MQRRTSVGAAIAVIGSLATCSVAFAQDPITIRVASGQAAASVYEVEGTKFWMDKVAARVGDKIKFEYYPGAQLAKPDKMLSALELRLADVVQFGSAYENEKLPLTGIMNLPGMYETPCGGTVAFKKQMVPGATLFDAEYKDRDFNILFLFANPQNAISTANREIRRPQDMEGLKIRVSSGLSARMMAAVGAAGVMISGPETYQSFARGTVDGVQLSWSAVNIFGLDKLVKFTTSGFGFGSALFMWGINKDVWNKLPEDVQQAMLEAGEETSMHICKVSDDRINEIGAEMKKNGTTISVLTAEEKDAFQAKLEPAVAEWVSQMESRNLPAQAVVDEFRAASKLTP